jgi:hypothetical protein
MLNETKEFIHGAKPFPMSGLLKYLVAHEMLRPLTEDEMDKALRARVIKEPLTAKLYCNICLERSYQTFTKPLLDIDLMLDHETLQELPIDLKRQKLDEFARLMMKNFHIDPRSYKIVANFG